MPAAEERLIAHFGAVDLRSPQFIFDKTHYYDEEMGSPIYRYFLSFEKLTEPSAIAAAKIIPMDWNPNLRLSIPACVAPLISIPVIWNNPKSYWLPPKIIFTAF